MTRLGDEYLRQSGPQRGARRFDRKRRVLGDFGCEDLGSGYQFGHHRDDIDQSPDQRLGGGDPATGLEHQRGALHANDTGQGVGDAEAGVRGEFDEVGREPRLGCGDTEVGDERKAKASSDGCPLNGSDDRLSGAEQARCLFVERGQARLAATADITLHRGIDASGVTSMTVPAT